MKTCPECHIFVGGPDSFCPLCGTALLPSGGHADEDRLYPDFSQPQKHRSRFPFLAKIFAFLSLIAVVVCGLIDLILTHRLTWSLFVIGGIAAAWASVGLHFLSDKNLNEKLLVDLCSLSLYLVLIDYLTGWNKWSVDYVIPCLYLAIMITVIVLAIIFRKYWREYILSIAMISVLGIVPLIIFLKSQSPFRYFCLAAALMAAALMAGLLFFAGGKFFSEWKRRMSL